MTDKKAVYLTREGYEDAKKELDYLINVKRPENIIAIKEARALGDLSENADYDAARNEQAELEDKIKKLQAIIDNGTIIDEITTDKCEQEDIYYAFQLNDWRYGSCGGCI